VEGLNDDLRTTNERLGQLETSATLVEMKTAQTMTNDTLSNIVTQLAALSQQVANVAQNQPTHNTIGGYDFDNYSGDTEHDELSNNNNVGDRRRQPANQRGRIQQPHRCEVCNQDDTFVKIKFTIPSFNGKYNPDAYLDWEIFVDKKFACHNVHINNQVKTATSEFTDFASPWWREHCTLHPNNIPTSWAALKFLTRHRFVLSYYARDMLNKVQCLQQGSKSVEEYFQELQIGMLRSGLVENADAAMARFFRGLNREIQDVLDYKEYNNITRLFHLTCKAEREVQGRQTRSRTIFSIGHTSSWKPGSAFTTPPNLTSLPSITNKQPMVVPAPTLPASTAAKASHHGTASSSSIASSGRTRDIQCTAARDMVM
jgi:hypothetical protein